MAEVSAGGMGPQMYAMTKTLEVQEQAVMKVLESAAEQTQAVQQAKQADTAALTGVGGNLNIKV